ncbi:hypothetical protein FGO68_gene4296 [Halteria grandinella]|uniref:Uncharacterized protein n=1 Tax=Halteria grandinella TaxID=5974 RepID=A0A8J8T809_HALGN|nr:hypothetical protein FGO68_gene4296 [Halteria grandinella]
MTKVQPSVINAGSQKVRLLPPPVGIRAITSLPLSTAFIISFQVCKKVLFPNILQLNSVTIVSHSYSWSLHSLKLSLSSRLTGLQISSPSQNSSSPETKSLSPFVSQDFRGFVCWSIILSQEEAWIEGFTEIRGLVFEGLVLRYWELFRGLNLGFLSSKTLVQWKPPGWSSICQRKLYLKILLPHHRKDTLLYLPLWLFTKTLSEILTLVCSLQHCYRMHYQTLQTLEFSELYSDISQ